MSQILEQTKEILLIENSLEFVVESYREVSLCEGDENNQTFLKLTGIFQKGNIPNGNKRIYKTELLIRENDRFQTRISSGLALGKGYHPGFFDKGGPAGVTDVSHRVTKTWMEGDVVKGELLIFKTSIGKDIEAIIEGGGKIGISSRGYGSMKRFDNVTIKGKTFKDVWVVDENYRLETYDLVLTPSVKSAIMHTVKESANKLNKFSEAKADMCNEKNLEEKKGGIKSMTLEELKAQHPALYNTVHEAGTKEGRKIGESDAKAILIADHIKVIEVKDLEIKTVKESNDTLTSENIKLKTDNKNLIDKNTVLEADKTKDAVKNAVREAINASEFKNHMGETEIVDICRVVSTVEDAKKEVDSRIKFIENVVAKKVGEKKTDAGKKIDTSEEGSTTENDADKKVNEEFKKQQRQAAGF